MLEEARVLGYDPKSAEMKDFTSRLQMYGASQEFCARIYANGITADMESGGNTAQGVAIPRLGKGKGGASGVARKDGKKSSSHTRSSIERGYATARARALKDAPTGVRVGHNNPRPRVRRGDDGGDGRGGGTFLTELGGDLNSNDNQPRQLWEEPDVIGFDDPEYPTLPRATRGPRPVSPLTLAAEAAAEAVYGATATDRARTLPPGAGPLGGRHVLSQYKSQATRLEAADSWYAQNRGNAKKATVKGQVESDIQNMLLSSREIAGRLRPKPVARKTTINFLSTPKMPRGALDCYEGSDPAEWTYWKRQELAREEEAAAAKRERLERWSQQKRDQMKRWKEDREALERATREQEEALEKERKRYARELGKYIASKNPEEVDDFKSRREKQVRRATELKVKKKGDFNPYSNTKGALEVADTFGKISMLDTLPDIHRTKKGGADDDVAAEEEESHQLSAAAAQEDDDAALGGGGETEEGGNDGGSSQAATSPPTEPGEAAEGAKGEEGEGEKQAPP